MQWSKPRERNININIGQAWRSCLQKYLLTLWRKTRLAKAQQQILPLETICSKPLYQTINAHSKAIGCPMEFLYYPLLSITAGCMGVRHTHKWWVEGASHYLDSSWCQKRRKEDTSLLKTIKAVIWYSRITERLLWRRYKKTPISNRSILLRRTSLSFE